VRAESESEQMRKFSLSEVGLVEIKFIAVLIAYNSADKMAKQIGNDILMTSSLCLIAQPTKFDDLDPSV
jgi:hypothetical protein